MAKPSTKPIQQLIWEQKLKIAELEDEIRTQTYFETMPEYGPTYNYCFSTSNFSIPHPQQSIDNWIKAVIKHMGTRSFGHGGAYTNAMLVSIPLFNNEQSMEKWLSYTIEKIRKKATPRKRKKTN
jgi:hypothetical protein